MLRGSAENRAKAGRGRIWRPASTSGFARRHTAAFAGLTERIGLDYFIIDCAETRDGRLLVFEADVAAIVHDMDPPDIFPYKPPQMRKKFAAFQAMLAAGPAPMPDTPPRSSRPQRSGEPGPRDRRGETCLGLGLRRLAGPGGVQRAGPGRSSPPGRRRPRASGLDTRRALAHSRSALAAPALAP